MDQSKPRPQFYSGIENPILYTISTFWPFIFFTDTLIIREKSISIVNRIFFLSAWADTFPIKTLTGVYLSTALIFASLIIARKDPAKEYEMHFLKKREAVKAKEIIDGLLLVKEGLIKLPEDASIEEKIKILRGVSKDTILNSEIKRP